MAKGKLPAFMTGAPGSKAPMKGSPKGAMPMGKKAMPFGKKGAFGKKGGK